MTQIPAGQRVPRGYRSQERLPEPKPRSIIPDGVTKALQQRKREIAEKSIFRLPMSGKCPKCGKEFKGLKIHYRKCKG